MEDTEAIGEFVEEHLYRPLVERAEQDQRDRLADLAATALSPTQVLDYYMVAEGSYSATEWANVRDVSPQATWENVQNAKDQLNATND